MVMCTEGRGSNQARCACLWATVLTPMWEAAHFLGTCGYQDGQLSAPYLPCCST